MFLGAFFVALAGLLTRLRSKSKRRRRRRLKVWRRRRYSCRSRPQGRQSASATEPLPLQQETLIATLEESGSPDLSSTVLSRRDVVSVAANADQPTAGFAAEILSVEKSISSASNDVASVRKDEQQATVTSSSSKNLAVDDNCSLNREDQDGAESRDTPAPELVPSGLGSSSCEVVSMKSPSCGEKCPQAVSKDSGYAGTSVNSIKSQVEGDTSEAEYDDNLNVNITGFEVFSSDVDIPDTWVSAIVEEGVLDMPSFCDKMVVAEQPALEDTSTELDLPATSVEDDACTTSDSFGSKQSLLLSEFPEISITDTISTADSEEMDTGSSTITENDNDSADETDTDCEEEICTKKIALRHVHTNGIALEGMKRSQDGGAVVGTILVRNDCYEKEVAVRHSSNAWSTYEDTPAQWVESVEGGAFDRFKFSVDLPEGSFHMELAFSFYQKWDNNDGYNYVFSS